MSMKKLEHLKHVLCEELDELSDKNSISATELDYVYKYTTSIKNIDKIIMADRYSNQGSYADSYRGSYDNNSYDGESYADSYDGRSYRRSYNDGRSMRNRYSYGNEKEAITERIQSMMDGEMDPRDKEVLKQALQALRSK